MSSDGQEVGRALDPAEDAADGAGERLGEQGLADAGDVLDEEVTAGEQRDEREPDRLGLAPQDPPDLLGERRRERARSSRPAGAGARSARRETSASPRYVDPGGPKLKPPGVKSAHAVAAPARPGQPEPLRRGGGGGRSTATLGGRARRRPPARWSIWITTLTRGARAATTSTASWITRITSSHSPSTFVNIALVSQRSPLSRTTRTASATRSPDRFARAERRHRERGDHGGDA